MDWRTTMHANELLTIFQQCLHMYYSWKIVIKPLGCLGILQSMWRGSKKYQIYGTNLSHTLKKKKNLSTWFGEQPCMQMDFRQSYRNITYISIPEKLSEIHLHTWLLSNPCGKVLIIVGISWSPDLRVQHIRNVGRIEC